MPLTPETLPKHELVGLHVRVVESADPGRVGIEGRVVGETTRTLIIGSEARSASEHASDGNREQGSGVRRVPKRDSTFEFVIDEAAADREAAGTASEPGDSGGVADEAATSSGDDVAYVTVDGEALLSRPARRTENGVDSIWR